MEARIVGSGLGEDGCLRVVLGRLAVPVVGFECLANNVLFRNGKCFFDAHRSVLFLQMALVLSDIVRQIFGGYELSFAKQDGAFRSKIASLPRSLHDALDALSADREFLTCGKVFTDSFLDTWIEAKRANESAQVRARPHPYEYDLYLDV